MKKLRLVTLAVLGVVLLGPLQASAIENGGVGGRPANPSPTNPRTKSIFIYSLKPGEQTTDGVLVSNNTNTEQTIAVYPVDSILSSGGAFACKQAVEPKNDVGSWIALDSDTVTVEPNASKTVSFTLTVPANASVGEHDGCIALQAASQTAKASSTSGVVLSFRSAIRVVVTVPGKIVKKLSIASVKVSSAKDNKLLVVPTVRNDGNVSIDTTSQIQVRSLIGASTTTKEGSSPVLPHSSESWQYEVKRPFWGGFYRAKIVASYDSNPAAGLGADANAKLTDIARTSAVFFVVPAAGALVVELVVLLLLIAIVVWLVRRAVQARRVKHQWTGYTVKKGDTIQTLASGHSVSWKQIAKANKLKAPYHLEPGQKLTVPPRDKE